jgi:hypothetical protein
VKVVGVSVLKFKRNRTLVRYQLGQCIHPVVKIILGVHFVDKPDIHCFRGVNQLIREDQPHCLALDDEFGQSLGSSATRNNTKVDLRLIELGVFGRESNVACLS